MQIRAEVVWVILMLVGRGAVAKAADVVEAAVAQAAVEEEAVIAIVIVLEIVEDVDQAAIAIVV
jgi:hypothetical protein